MSHPNTTSPVPFPAIRESRLLDVERSEQEKVRQWMSNHGFYFDPDTRYWYIRGPRKAAEGLRNTLVRWVQRTAITDEKDEPLVVEGVLL